MRPVLVLFLPAARCPLPALAPGCHPYAVCGSPSRSGINRQFVAERPNQLWVADFTYGVPGVQGEQGRSNEPRVCLEY